MNQMLAAVQTQVCDDTSVETPIPTQDGIEWSSAATILPVTVSESNVDTESTTSETTTGIGG